MGTHSFLGFAHEINAVEPLPERQMGIVKDRFRLLQNDFSGMNHNVLI